MTSSVSRLFTSQTGPLILGRSGEGQDIRHSKPQWGHLVVFAPFSGPILSMQFMHLTSPVLLPLAVISADVSSLNVILFSGPFSLTPILG